MAQNRKLVFPGGLTNISEALSSIDTKAMAELEGWLGACGYTAQEILEQFQDLRMESLLVRLAYTLDDRRKNRAAFEAFPGHISWVSKDLTYLAVNEGLAKSVGLKPSDFIGEPVGFINKESPFLAFVKEFMLREVEDDRQLLEVYTPHLNEYRWFSVVAHKYNGGEAAVVIGLDVTELRHVQQLVSDLQAKETLMMRLATLGEVAAGMTHEINNPLAVISTGLYALKDHLESEKHLDQDVTNLITMMEKATKHVATIVAGAHHLSRGDSRKVESSEIVLLDAVHDALALCGEKIKKASVKVNIKVEPELTAIVQSSALLQILINLVSNACDALEELKLAMDKRWIDIVIVKKQDRIQITITDSGPGIPKHIQKTMFQPFFTTKAPGKGTGLGLSIVKNLVEKHQGRIFLDPEATHTCFVIDLPGGKKKLDLPVDGPIKTTL